MQTADKPSFVRQRVKEAAETEEDALEVGTDERSQAESAFRNSVG